MSRLFHFRFSSLLPVIALALAGLLGGCVAYPAYPGYGYGYGYGAPYYYPGPVVAYGGGRGWHHDHDGWR